MTDDGDKALTPSSNQPEELPEELKKIAQEVGEEKVRRILAIRSEQYSGPLPHPRLFAEYGRALPDAPERILRMAEKEQDHNLAVGMKMLDGDEKRANWGLGLGFVLVVSLFLGAIYLLAIGYELAGYASLGVIALGGIVNFIRVGRERRSDEKPAN